MFPSFPFQFALAWDRLNNQASRTCAPRIRWAAIARVRRRGRVDRRKGRQRKRICHLHPSAKVHRYLANVPAVPSCLWELGSWTPLDLTTKRQVIYSRGCLDSRSSLRITQQDRRFTKANPNALLQTLHYIPDQLDPGGGCVPQLLDAAW